MAKQPRRGQSHAVLIAAMARTHTSRLLLIPVPPPLPPAAPPSLAVTPAMQAAITDLILRAVEAHGKNLFYFFGRDKANTAAATVVMHVHFGMSGAFKIFPLGHGEPEPTSTTRLRLEQLPQTAGPEAASASASAATAAAGPPRRQLLGGHLSAMTVQHGGLDLYQRKAAELGADPLREDADPEWLWSRVSRSRKSIGALLMDQGFFAGVGNIYRAEILFKAGVHPEVKGSMLSRLQFDAVWRHSVLLMQRGFSTGSILTVDQDEAVALGDPRRRRHIYNQSRCFRCGGPVTSWQINARTCYCCPHCQPLPEAGSGAVDQARAHLASSAAAPRLFDSHCAPEALAQRRRDPAKLKVAELRAELQARGLPRSGNKAALVARLAEDGFAAAQPAGPAPGPAPGPASAMATPPEPGVCRFAEYRSYAAARADKLAAHEPLNVEHVADVDFTTLVDWTDLHGDYNGRGAAQAAAPSTPHSAHHQRTVDGAPKPSKRRRRESHGVDGAARSAGKQHEPNRARSGK